MKCEKGVGNLPVVELYSSKDSAVNNIQTGFICYINYLNTTCKYKKQESLSLGGFLPENRLE
jgi:hypothetical protein